MSTNLPSFEKADYAVAPALEHCARCQQPLRDRFFRVAGEPMCEPCAHAAVISPVAGASSAFARAVTVGIGAAIVGSILYAIVEIATGWTIGYVALAVGWLVGRGMKWGSEGRGGRRYQIAAAILTYLSVSFAGVIVMIHAAMKDMPAGVQFGFRPGFLPVLAKDVLLAPLLELRGGLNGIIGLFILFIGVRTAWSMTGGSEYRITGPYQGASQD